ncbi:hypothetical protein [Amphritea sp.]|uniref:hypothetical protein n=1 Tax=Amphritea sp. TaxID=1872502 RepID=UPI0025BDBE1B|nr:hypothetical protein [Amphritea sp.]
MASHQTMNCDGDSCDMVDADCCETELPGCCLQLSVALFLWPAGFHGFSSAQSPPAWTLSAYHSAISPPVYHPPRTAMLSV